MAQMLGRCAVGVVAALWILPIRAGGASEHVGVATCKTCHEAEYRQWRLSGHAGALERLSVVQQRDRVCRSCHTMEPMSDDVELSGVQCESCHGAGGLYSPRYVMKDRVLSELLGLKKVTAETCALCHKADGPQAQPFRFEEMIELVRHGPAGAAGAGKGEVNR